ncbi:MAG: hypothetical protein HY654_12825 [Acidobacteria bacterium]|nr:hypothetical protein [Acidobacteriota bacterium]
MWFRTLGCCLLMLVTASTAAAQECPTGKPTVVSRALPAAVGQKPLWVTASSLPIKWEGNNSPVQLVWVIDAAAGGLVMVSGKHVKSSALVRFTRFGDTLGERQPRYEISRTGYKPSLAKPGDLLKFAFDRNFAWFPEPGCYEITARVGRLQPKIYLEVAKTPGK